MFLLGAAGKAAKRQDGSSQPLFSHLGSAPAPAESSPGLEAVFKSSVGATEVSGETVCSLAMGCLEEILSTRERGETALIPGVAAAPHASPFLLVPCPSCGQVARLRKASSKSTAHFCQQDHAAVKGNQSRTGTSHRPFQTTPGAADSDLKERGADIALYELCSMWTFTTLF